MALIFTPGGMGTMIKSYYFKQKLSTSHSKIIPVAFFERYHDLLGITILIVITLFLFYSLPSVIIASISTTLLIMIYVVIQNQSIMVKIQTILEQIRWIKKFIPNRELNTSIQELSKFHPITLGIGISILSWIIDATAVYFVFKGFLQTFEFLNVFQLYYSSLVYGAISLLLGGLGVTEGSFLGMLMTYSLDISIASSIVIMTRLITVWFATICGLISTYFIINKK